MERHDQRRHLVNDMSLGVLPSWYCPPGIRKPPAYVRFQEGIQPLMPGKGPDVDADPKAKGGGIVFGGGCYVDKQPGWVKTEAGYWVRFQGALPQHLTRIDLHPRVVSWVIIDGAYPGHEWLIPVLARPLFKKGSDVAHCFQSALERIWSGGKFKDPQDLAGIQDRLIHVAQGLQIEGRGFDPMFRLVLDLIKLGHHSMDETEFNANEWITQRFAIRVFAAAVGLEHTSA